MPPKFIPPQDGDRGVLNALDVSPYIAVALRALPSAGTLKVDRAQVVVDVPNYGRVLFTCRRFVQKRKAMPPFWHAIKAERVDAGQQLENGVYVAK